MDRWFLMISTLLALVVAIQGMIAVHRGHRSRWTPALMMLVVCGQTAFLAMRGQARQVCPLADLGEVLTFLAWSLTLFYMLVGPAYRISLLGVFTAPVIFLFQSVALLPGVLDVHPHPLSGGNPWHETHSATSVLAYGAFALAAVAGVMFLVLNQQLKAQHLKSGLFRNLPPVRELLTSLTRLLWLGIVLLTIGIIAGFRMPHQGAPTGHFIAAMVVWATYLSLLIIKQIRGLTGKRLSILTVAIFILSLAVFAFV
ncbi:MAG TPA: cytochrome c biogenesis protein CcsA [Luteolibacter sp.]|nr:cytochrome c biogenesis protein CcsA [Luteolibacter sp.]